MLKHIYIQQNCRSFSDISKEKRIFAAKTQCIDEFMPQLTTQDILQKLKAENCFWSYSEDSVKNIPDDILIEKTLVYLDLPEIDALFQIFPYKMIKKVWLEQMVPQGEYLFTLNRFLAWYYFHVKRPDQYLKAMTTRHFNKMFS